MKDINKLLEEVTELNKNKEYNKVIEILTDEVLKNQNNSDLYAESAMAFWNLKNYEGCNISAKKAIEIYPSNTKALRCFGNIYFNLKDYEKAEEYYLKAIEINPNDAAPYNALGSVYFKLKEYERAKKSYIKATKLEPNEAGYFNNLGNIYAILNDFKKAKENYLKAIDKNPKNDDAYNGLGNVYYELKDYKNAKENYQIYLKLDKNKEDYFYNRASSKIAEIEKIVENSTYSKVNKIVEKIKELLKFKGESVTHYTGISSVQFLILKESPLRLSEGSFLNDTSEGQELFSFLDYFSGENVNKKCNKEIFTRRPFIGSFVDAEKNNDLTLWRMYGKEQKEEAKGCSITLNVNNLVSNIKNKICPDKNFSPSEFDDIKFYRVAYRYNDKFEFFGATQLQNQELTKLMGELLDAIFEYKNKVKKQNNEEKDVIELLNQIAYLFKSSEYKYENEIRLIFKDGIGFEKKLLDFNIGEFKPSSKPIKVIIELVPILNILNKITIGPKVDKAEEWASTFYYHLANKELFPEIQVSKLPYK